MALNSIAPLSSQLVRHTYLVYEEEEEEGGLVYPMEQEDKVTEDSEEPFNNETKQITKTIEKLFGKKEKRQIVR